MSKSKRAMKKQLQTMFKGLSRPFCMENAKNGLPKSHEFKLSTFSSSYADLFAIQWSKFESRFK